MLEKADEDSYWVQKVPVLPELKRRLGVKQKQAAWRLERIPSSVVVHKRLDSADTRWVEQTSKLQNNPLEHNLGSLILVDTTRLLPEKSMPSKESKTCWVTN